MWNTLTKLILPFFFLFILFDLPAQEASANIFLDCRFCENNYLREAIPYIHYVRNKEDANVHVLVTRMQAANMSSQYTFDFIGKGDLSHIQHQLTFVAPPNSPRQTIREGIATKIETGLLPFWIENGKIKELEIKVESKEAEDSVEEKKDKWDNWIFEIGGGGSLSKESNKENFRVWGRIRANRVTEKWRIRNSVYARLDERRFTQGETEFSSSIHNRNFNSNVVKSIGEHWAIGGFTYFYGSSYGNVDFGNNSGPAVEFNVFPYKEVNRKELTLTYRVNYHFRDYNETTIFGFDEEGLWNQSLVLYASFTQPWGSFFCRAEGAQLFKDFSQNHLYMESSLKFRIVKGLSIDLRCNYNLINDQRSLPAGDLTIEELLLAQKQLATNYRFSTSIGLSYSFGSIYNDVVNTRL